MIDLIQQRAREIAPHLPADVRDVVICHYDGDDIDDIDDEDSETLTLACDLGLLSCESGDDGPVHFSTDLGRAVAAILAETEVEGG